VIQVRVSKVRPHDANGQVLATGASLDIELLLHPSETAQDAVIKIALRDAVIQGFPGERRDILSSRTYGTAGA
jgi:hypothetical protein